MSTCVTMMETTSADLHAVKSLHRPDSWQQQDSIAGVLVEAHVNEHGDGVVAVVGPKEVVRLLLLPTVGGSAP